MSPVNFTDLFSASFDLFKAFDNLTVQSAGENSKEVPKTIWQILNHLISWQAQQLKQLQLTDSTHEMSEPETWIDNKTPENQKQLHDAICLFKSQIEQFKNNINEITIVDPKLAYKLKILQDLTLHLSFHVGEVILLRRIARDYPMPHQMKEFLKEF